MARYRIVGIVCDVVRCDNESELIGGATHSDVELLAHRSGWTVVGRGIKALHYCPEHVDEAEK